MKNAQLEIRDATQADFEGIVRLLPSREELFLVYPNGTHPFSVDQLRRLADVRKDLTVLLQNGEVIGFANLYDLEPGRWVFIGNVVITRALRGTGLGRMLVGHMVEASFGKYGLPEARISVFNGNTPALLLYAGLGFRPYAIEARQDPIGNRVALIHMRINRNDYRA